MTAGTGERHTPGPWEVVCNATNFSIIGLHIGKIALVFPSPLSSRRVKGLANAKIMAAAPDMLAAGNELAQAASDIHPTAPSSASIDRLDAAIDAWGTVAAKATAAEPTP